MTKLNEATNEEVFTEFMKRVTETLGGRPACLFIDALGCGEREHYGIHHANDELEKVNGIECHVNFLKTNKF